MQGYWQQQPGHARGINLIVRRHAVSQQSAQHTPSLESTIILKSRDLARYGLLVGEHRKTPVKWRRRATTAMAEGFLLAIGF